MEIFIEGTAIILKKYRPTCIFCDNAREISIFKGKSICSRCLHQLRDEN